ncbi:PKD domain-containing protein [Alloalcanivorax marinus]|uniref:PKD domain-containing protein n=1 Tax=Alloalcanivorax marinus TaxID=1177169 RepID=UPI001933DFB6|nr:PKD domain-containing protein [Alloalcanivorax marinus]MBL7252020.1 PKD domain-containing protein [Alloalcanivorax marinus]
MIRRIGYGVLAGLILSGCGGGGGSDSPAVEPGEPNSGNTAPVAQVGPAQNVKVGDTVILDGSGSRDADGDALSYQWELATLPDGSTANLSDTTSPKPRFQADAAGRYVATLVVSDGELDSEPASVAVTASIQNSAPVADAGPDQNVATGDLVRLDGRSSSDADGDPLTYQWSFVATPAGSGAELQDAASVEPSFTPDLDGEYRLALVVNDGLTESDADEVVITATTANSAPVANAGADQNTVAGSTVTLDGAASTDADNDELSYQWRFVSRPAGSTAALTGVDTARPSFEADQAGDYVVELIVNDGSDDSAPDNVVVTVAAANAVPVADAGNDQTVVAGDSVTLDGAASSDADGDLLTYQWRFVSLPDGSQAALQGEDTVAPTFQADLPGSYVISLVVSDEEATSEAARVTVTATERNAAPVADAGDDQEVIEGATVHLDGSASSDANDDELFFQWRFVSRPAGSGATLTRANGVTPEFIADQAGTFVLELVVNDGELDSVPATVTVTVTRANVKPVADAGPDQSVVEGDIVLLDGSGSSDPDGDSLSYRWRFISTPDGSAAMLSDEVAPAPNFTADLPGTYVVGLIVGDGELDSTEDRVTVVAAEANAAPMADAGRDVNALTGTLVTLDGSASSDANGDALTYHWRFVSRPDGSTTALVNATTASPSFTPDLDGTYVLELVVNDGELDSAGDRVQVVAETVNNAPVADAGPNQTVYTGNRVELDGSGSYDPEGDALSYAWSTSSLPTGSAVTLVDATTVRPSLTPDQAGDYVIKLTVNDGEKTSQEDTVRITALEPDLAMEQYDEGDAFDPPRWFNVGLPYSSSSTINRTCSGSCGTIELARFRLEAKGRSYTLRNVQVTRLSGTLPPGLNPRFSGLVSDDTVEAGETRTFSLLVENVNASVQLDFAFEVDGTGETFSSRYTLNFR